MSKDWPAFDGAKGEGGRVRSTRPAHPYGDRIPAAAQLASIMARVSKQNRSTEEELLLPELPSAEGHSTCCDHCKAGRQASSHHVVQHRLVTKQRERGSLEFAALVTENTPWMRMWNVRRFITLTGAAEKRRTAIAPA